LGDIGASSYFGTFNLEVLVDEIESAKILESQQMN